MMEFLTKYIDHSYCSSCGAIASQKAILDAHGATVMEKYCDTSLSNSSLAAYELCQESGAL